MRGSKGKSGLLPNLLRIISSCLKTVSSNAGTVASTVRSTGASVAASIAMSPEDVRDQVNHEGTQIGAAENDKLKMETELAMQEYILLEETNKQLKEQTAKFILPEVQGVASSSASQQMEDEKEAKKAIRDELTKRVSDMSSDNNKLKMHVHWKQEKELAMQTDKKLKEQMAKTVRPEVQGASSSAASK